MFLGVTFSVSTVRRSPGLPWAAVTVSLPAAPLACATVTVTVRARTLRRIFSAGDLFV